MRISWLYFANRQPRALGPVGEIQPTDPHRRNAGRNSHLRRKVDPAVTPDKIIEKLDLQPHPEGGWYRQTWIADATDGDRPSGTCIYFLLKSGSSSHWHRVDAAEIWHYYAGSPLILSIAASENGPAVRHLLGPDLAADQRPDHRATRSLASR